MQISPIPTLSDDINDIRTRTANIVAEKIIPNEREIYSRSENSVSVRKEIKEEVEVRSQETAAEMQVQIMEQQQQLQQQVN